MKWSEVFGTISKDIREQIAKERSVEMDRIHDQRRDALSKEISRISDEHITAEIENGELPYPSA